MEFENVQDLESTNSSSTPTQEQIVIEEESTQSKFKPQKGSIFKRMAEWKYSHLILCFSIPFLAVFVVYAVIGTHPFGNESVLALDLQAQYVYYYEAVRKLLVSGGSWLYSWQRTLGGEMMGIIDYYMASGFNIILVLFPKENIADAVMLIQLCKVGSMGLTMGLYLYFSRKLNKTLTVMFSCMYAMCAYAIVEMVNPMWEDAVLLLPLVVLGVELLVRQKRILLYTTALALTFITNYYIGYMVAIFTLIYFCYYYGLVRPELLKKEPIPDNVEGVGRFFKSYGFKTFIRIALCTIFAICVAAFSIYSAYYSLQFGKSTFSSSTSFDAKLRFDLLDFFIKLLPGSYDSVRPTGLPMVYCGLIALICLPLFYTSKHISTRHKWAASFVVIILFFSMLINTVDLVWHGFSAPNWLNYRYSFVFSFFLVVIAADTINGLKKVSKMAITISISLITAIVLVIQKLDIKFDQDTKQNELSDAGCILLTVILAIAYLVILLIMKKKSFKKSASIILCAVVIIELMGVSVLSVTSLHTDVGNTKYDNYLNGTSESYSSYNGGNLRIMDVVKQVLDSDKSFYRMESTVYRKNGGVNEPYAFGYNGIAHSTSTLNADVIKLIGTLGYASQSHWTKYLGGTPVSDALLGIKYVVTKNDTLDKNIYSVYKQGDEGYQLVKSTNTIYALQNNKALSLAYGVSDSFATEMTYVTKQNYRTALEIQNNVINAMLADTAFAEQVFKGVTASMTAENCVQGTFTNNHKFTNDKGEEVLVPTQYYKFENATSGAKVIFDIVCPETGDIYFHLPSANFGKTAKVYVNGNFLTDYFGTETSRVFKLGSFGKNQVVKVEVRLQDDILYFAKESRYYFYQIDYSALTRAFNYLSDAQMTIDKYGNDFVKGSITLPQGQTTIFTTIPYDTGWNIYVDGKKVEYVKVMDSLIAIPSTAGEHTLEFRYMPKGYVVSGIVAIISIVALVLLWLIAYVKKIRIFVYTKILKKNKVTMTPPVGDLAPLGEYPYYDYCIDLDEDNDDLEIPNKGKKDATVVTTTVIENKPNQKQTNKQNNKKKK